ncbi:unnamed protein product [Adineta ricciae]|nr:unnamed protein product [Adineta ricciae]
MKNRIVLTHDLSKEFNKTELQERIQDTRDSNLRILLGKVLALQDNSTILLASTRQQRNRIRQTWIIHGERTANDEFNLFIIDIHQIKEIDKLKLLIYELVFICFTIAADSIKPRKYKVLAIGTIVVVASIKIASDLNTYPPDVIYEYILQCSKYNNFFQN